MSAPPIPTFDPEPECLAASRAALAELCARQPDLCPPAAETAAWCARLAQVLAHNIAARRFEQARAYQPAGLAHRLALASYARQVLTELLAEAERLDRLRAGESNAWAAVIDRLERLAYHWYGAAGREAWALWEARDAAAATCADLWQWLQAHPYPFDVPFDRWAACALTHRLHDAARRRQRSEPTPVESLDQSWTRDAGAETWAEHLVDARSAAEFQRAAEREALLQAIARLDARRGLVVRLWYFEQWRADEIAAHLGERVGNIYVLRHRALKELKRHYLRVTAPGPQRERTDRDICTVVCERNRAEAPSYS